MAKFESEYGTGDLVKYRKDKDDNPHFGFIRIVQFHKSDAVNHAVCYDIEMVNAPDGTIERAVREDLIDCKYEEQA